MKNIYTILAVMFCFTSLSAGVVWVLPEPGEGTGKFVPDPSGRDHPGSKPPIGGKPGF